jgi:hypothetical protein
VVFRQKFQERYAQGAGRNPSGCCSPMQPGLQRKSRRKRIGASEELDGRNFAYAKLLFAYAAWQKNAPKFRNNAHNLNSVRIL